MTSTEIPLFATSNLASCEQYLFLNHPTTFVRLTSDSEHDHYSSESNRPEPSLERTSRSRLPTHRPNLSSPALGSTAPDPFSMQRQQISNSTSSSISSDPEPTGAVLINTADDYLGGGAVRHPLHCHTDARALTTALSQQQQPPPPPTNTTVQHRLNLAQLAALSAETTARADQAHQQPRILSQLSRPSTTNSLAEVEAQRQQWNRDVMTWWPLPVEVLEREWSEEFYD